ncbi:MAG: 23S rRNA (adenine(2503)-C(2))-methyltransferase RlmN [Clostridia bacterium]|nr:23S rRNA (adenine(2503)-C(2))-methyltransferase RlmN [Clostridia bacterium]
MENKTDLLSLSRDEIVALTESLGEPRFRAEQLLSWTARGVPIGEMSNIPKSFREKLSKVAFVTRPATLSHQRSKDGTEKFLFGFSDGQSAECVLMRYRNGNSACLSTQIGCRMGCAFCASTRNGLIRDLTAGEILAEVFAVMRESGEKISRLVLMGTGEPLDNFANVMKFIDLVTSPDGLNLGARHISLSTSGIVPQIDRLALEKRQITLSVSLHAPNDEKRNRLMPVNRAYPIAELMASCRRYFEITGRRISFEYAMIEGINDGEEDAEELAALLKDMQAHVNLIPLNRVKESPFRPSPRKRVDAFVGILSENGVNVTVRRRLGSDIDAACGQLRANNMPGNAPEKDEVCR